MDSLPAEPQGKSHRLIAIPIKFQNIFHKNRRKKKSVLKQRRLQIDKSILTAKKKKKIQNRGITLPNFKLYYEATVIKTVVMT